MRIRAYQDLQQFHTFGVPWQAQVFCSIQEVESARQAIAYAQEKSMSVFVLGGGSNILPTHDYKGLVIKNEIAGRAVIDKTPDHTIVRIGSGESWHSLVEWSLENNLYGLENLVLIPGTVGGAVVQNIGAYDVELAGRVESVEVIDLQSALSYSMSPQECRFAYRSSIFKEEPERFMITGVDIRLDNVLSPVLSYQALKEFDDTQETSAVAIASHISSIRTSKLPNPEEVGTAGSFFANPRVSNEEVARLSAQYPDMPVFHNYGSAANTIPAAWLIEHLDSKPECAERFLYSKHALVVVNPDKNGSTVSGKDIAECASALQEAVANEYGIQLRREVVVL